MRISDWSSDVCSSDLSITAGTARPSGRVPKVDCVASLACAGIAALASSIATPIGAIFLIIPLFLLHHEGAGIGRRTARSSSPIPFVLLGRAFPIGRSVRLENVAGFYAH